MFYQYFLCSWNENGAIFSFVNGNLHKQWLTEECERWGWNREWTGRACPKIVSISRVAKDVNKKRNSKGRRITEENTLGSFVCSKISTYSASHMTGIKVYSGPLQTELLYITD